MIERKAFLADLILSAESAKQQNGRVVLLSGEAGLGKTTLLNAFRQSLLSDYNVFWGGCDPFETPRPLGPVYDLTHNLIDPLSIDEKEHGAASRLFSMILSALEKSKTPTILILEDAHWADNATLDFIRYLGRRIRFLRTALIISFRDDEVDRNHPLRTAIGDLPQSAVQRIALKPLSKAGVKKLANAAGAASTGLFKITGGNPFFVTELIEAHAAANTDVPISIREAVNARLNRLPEKEQQFLETLSHIPSAFTIRVLHHFYGETGQIIAQNCVARKFLNFDSKSGEYRFRHELARLSTLDRVDDVRQKETHLYLLKYLQNQTQPNYNALVHHAIGAEQISDVLKYAPLAAQRAAILGAHREAADFLSKALTYIEHATPEQQAELYEAWAYEASMALQITENIIEARHKAIGIWKALGRPEKIGENYRALSRLHWYRGESRIASDYSDRAIAILEDRPPSRERAMAYSLRSQIDMLNDNMDAAIIWGEKALDLAEQFNDIEVQVHALNNVGTARVFRGDDTGVAMLEDSLALSLKHHLHEDAARAYTNLSEYGLEFGDYELAEKTLNDSISFSNRYDIKSFSPYLSGRLAQLKLQRGLYTEAKAIADTIVRQPQATLLMQLPAGLVLASCEMREGNNNADKLLNSHLTRALATEELQYIIPARLALMEQAWINNTPDEAIIHFKAMADLPQNKLHPWNRGMLALWGKRLKFDISGLITNDMSHPFHLELSGQHKEAAKIWEKIGAPYNQSLALINDTSPQSDQSLIKAITVLQSINAKIVLDKAIALAQSRGITAKLPKTKRGPYHAARTHPLGLTKKEQQILILMTKGHSNRNIAELISRSQRTIEHHVSSILKKLNVANRTDAIMRVSNEPWIFAES